MELEFGPHQIGRNGDRPRTGVTYRMECRMPNNHHASLQSFSAVLHFPALITHRLALACLLLHHGLIRYCLNSEAICIFN